MICSGTTDPLRGCRCHFECGACCKCRCTKSDCKVHISACGKRPEDCDCHDPTSEPDPGGPRQGWFKDEVFSGTFEELMEELRRITGVDQLDFSDAAGTSKGWDAPKIISVYANFPTMSIGNYKLWNEWGFEYNLCLDDYADMLFFRTLRAVFFVSIVLWMLIQALIMWRQY